MSEPQDMRTRQMRVERRLAMWMVMPLLVLAGVYGTWCYSNAVPAFHMTHPPLPSPNAYDYYLRAAKMIDLVPDYERAFDPKTPPAQAAAIVKQCQPAIRTARAGFAYRCGVPYSGDAFDALHLQVSGAFGLRHLGRMLVADSRTALARGDREAALQSALDVLRLGIDAPRGGMAFDAYEGMALEGIGFDQLLRLEDHLSAAQCRRAARYLADLEAGRVPLVDLLRTERDLGRELLSVMARAPVKFQAALRQVGAVETGPTYVWNLRAAACDYDRWYDEALRQAALPRTARSRLPKPHSTLAQDWTSGTKGLLREYENPVAAWRLVPADLAVRVYLLEHGHPPRTLGELIPRYLAAVPEDPLAPGQPVRYRGTPRPVVYSVGPDGQDDGGTGVVWYEADTLGWPGAARSGDLLLRAEQATRPWWR